MHRHLAQPNYVFEKPGPLSRLIGPYGNHIGPRNTQYCSIAAPQPPMYSGPENQHLSLTAPAFHFRPTATGKHHKQVDQRWDEQGESNGDPRQDLGDQRRTTAGIVNG